MQTPVEGLSVNNPWKRADGVLVMHPELPAGWRPTLAEAAFYEDNEIEECLDLGAMNWTQLEVQHTAAKPYRGIKSSNFKPSLTIKIPQPVMMSCDGDCFLDGNFFCHGDPIEKVIEDFYNHRQGAQSEERQGNVGTPVSMIECTFHDIANPLEQAFKGSGVPVEDEYLRESSKSSPTSSEHIDEAEVPDVHDPQYMSMPERRVTTPIRRHLVPKSILHG